MKDICEGRRTKNDVVQESLHMYQEVFMKANRDVRVLIEVLRHFIFDIDYRRVSDIYGRDDINGYLGSSITNILIP